MDAVAHMPGQRDFLIEEKDVSVTEFRRKPSAVWGYIHGLALVEIEMSDKKEHLVCNISTSRLGDHS